MTKLYLVRHGETMDNAAQIMQGQTPGRLNDVGIQQAEEVARKMANDHIDVFVSSDLYRSMQTCAIIARPHLEAEMHLKGSGDAAAFLTEDDILQKIETTPLIRERDWGDFTGKFIPSLPKDPKDWPDNVETLERMKSRAQNFLTWLKVAYPDKTIRSRSWYHQQGDSECVLQTPDESDRENGECRSESSHSVMES